MQTSPKALHGFRCCRLRDSSVVEWPYQPGRDLPVGRLILFLRHIALGSLFSNVLVQCKHVCSHKLQDWTPSLRMMCTLKANYSSITHGDVRLLHLTASEDMKVSLEYPLDCKTTC